METLGYKVFLHKEPEGGFTVTVPSLPGCVTYGETLEQAQTMAQEAIALYLESLEADAAGSFFTQYATRNTESHG
ncbi:MAG: type II toxin-antitoxin system HicB family antitoxin [Anaerolineales bacterium]